MKAGCFDQEGKQMPEVFLVLTEEECKLIRDALDSHLEKTPKAKRKEIKRTTALRDSFDNLPVW